MSTSGSKSNEHVAHFLIDIHKLDELIKTYAYSEYGIFKEFALLLYKHKEPIIKFSIMTECVSNRNI